MTVEYGQMIDGKWQRLLELEVMDHLPSRGDEILLETESAQLDGFGDTTSAYYTVSHVLRVHRSIVYESNDRTVKKHAIRIVLSDNNIPETPVEKVETTHIPVAAATTDKPKKDKKRWKR